MGSRRYRVVGGAATAMAMAICAVALTGSVSFVTTYGSSMEPGFHGGDLAVVRPADSYEVGDVVAYRSRLLDTVVMHRVTARDGDRYVFKGDNNEWLDHDKPTQRELVGKLWWRVPKGGAALTWTAARWPLVTAGIVLSMLGGLAMTRRRRRHRKAGPPMTDTRSGLARRRSSNPRIVLAAAACALAACTLLGALAFGRPTARPVTTKVAYSHNGSFAYSASAPAGPVYGNVGVTTGSPVFLRLLQALDVRFTYRLQAEAARSVGGTVALLAEVADANGWRHTVALAAPKGFHGDEVELRATLDIARLQAVIAEVETLTGVRSATYTVAVAADARVTGTLAGQAVNDEFSPRLRFQLDALQLRPEWNNGAEGAGGDDVLTPSKPGAVHRPGTADRRIDVLGRSLAVGDARRLSVAGGLSSVLALLAAAAAGRRLRWSERARIAARHGHRIVPVAAARPEGSQAFVDVTTMEDLVRLADQYECLILHQPNERGDSYLFNVDRTVYRYVAGPPLLTRC